MAEECFQSVIVLPSTFDYSEEPSPSAPEDQGAGVCPRACVHIARFNRYATPISPTIAPSSSTTKSTGEMAGAFCTPSEPMRNHESPSPRRQYRHFPGLLQSGRVAVDHREIRVVCTDRAHVMIAAAMLGKPVEYRSSTYHKVPAIARYALRGYPVASHAGVRFAGNRQAASRLPAAGIVLCPLLCGTLRRRRVALVDDPGSLRSSVKYGKDDIVVISDGILLLQRCPQLWSR